MFRLARVLAWKERQEREALSALAAVERQLADLEAGADALVRERGTLPDHESDVERLAAWARYAEGLRRRESSLRARARGLAPQVEERRGAHRELRQEVEGLRKLREREIRRRRKRWERSQQEQLDDIAARRFLPGAGNFFPLETEPPANAAAGSGGNQGTGTGIPA
jgi:flagellar export protein FliJ